MDNMREHKLSSWRHKSNDANRGFFPTSLDVVKMEMNLIDFSEIEEGSQLNICDLTGGEGDQLKVMYDHIKEKGLVPIAYYNEVTNVRYNIAVERYKNLENFHLLKADFFNLKIRNKNSQKAFTIIRNNPPYSWMDFKGLNVRAEDIFFTRNAEFNVAGGIQIFELPLHQLIEQKNLLKKILFRYENVHIFRFPEKEFKKFKQVCVIGVKKAYNSSGIELADMWKEKLINNDIPSLDEVYKPVIKLSQKAINTTFPIVVYRDGKVTDDTLTNGFNSCFLDLIKDVRFNKDRVTIKKVKKIPIIEQTPGHIALDLYSGEYDGLLGNVLVKGGVKKEIKTIVEKQKNTTITTDIEVVYPFIEITSANGKTLIKEYRED